jgi:hypothetical protein
VWSEKKFSWSGEICGKSIQPVDIAGETACRMGLGEDNKAKWVLKGEIL